MKKKEMKELDIKVVTAKNGEVRVLIGNKSYTKEEVQGFFKRIRELSDFIEATMDKALNKTRKAMEELEEKKQALRVFMEYTGATEMGSDGITLQIVEELGIKIIDMEAYIEFAKENPEIIPANGYKKTVIKQMLENGIIPMGIEVTGYKDLKMKKTKKQVD